jgi:type III secretory pathway component EscU
MADLFPGPDIRVMAAEAGIPILRRVPFERALAATANKGHVFITGTVESAAASVLLEVASTIRKNLEWTPGP